MTIARHEQAIEDLRGQVAALRDGQAKKQLEAEIKSRMAELEADIKLQELQETMAQEEASKHRPRRFWHRS